MSGSEIKSVIVDELEGVPMIAFYFAKSNDKTAFKMYWIGERVFVHEGKSTFEISAISDANTWENNWNTLNLENATFRNITPSKRHHGHPLNPRGQK